MADFKKTIDIAIRIVSDTKVKLDAVSSQLNKLQTSINAIAKSSTVAASGINKLAGSLQKLEGFTPPSLTAFVKSVEKVTKIDTSKLTQLTAQLNEIGKVKFGSSLGTAITNFQNLSAVRSSKGLTKMVADLQKVSNMGKLPSIAGFANQLQALSSIGKLPNLQPFTTQLRAISKLRLTIPVNLSKLADTLKKFESVTKLPSLDKFIRSLQNLDKVRIPSFGKLVSDIDILARSFARLNKSSPIVATLNRIGQASENLESKMSALRKQTGRTTNAFDEFNKRIRNYSMYRIIADTIINIKEAFMGALIAIVDYSQALKNVQAITSSTEEETQRMGVAMKGVAARTKFSATEVGEGMKILGQAGLSAAESINTIQAVADLATGTLSDMAISVDLLTTAMRVYDIVAEDSAHIADVFANAVNRSKLTVEKLRISMNYVGPVAASANISLEETAAAMMILANSGLRASTIGTGLRRVLAELVDPSDKLAKATKRAGLNLAELDPTTNKISDVFRKLGIVLKDTQTAFDIFGKRGAAASLALVKDVSGGYDEMLAAANRFGTASEMAAIQMEGLGVAFKNLQDRIKLIAIALGEAGVASLLRKLIDAAKALTTALIWLIENGINPIINAFNGFAVSIIAVTFALVNLQKITKAFMALKFVQHMSAIAFQMQIASTATKAFAASQITLTAATKVANSGVLVHRTGMIGLGVAFKGTTGIIGKAVLALRIFGRALWAATGPVGIIAAGFIALVGAIQIFGDQSEKQIKKFRKLNEELDITKKGVEEYTEAIDDLSQKKDLDPDELLAFLHKTAKQFPEIAADIYATGGNFVELQKVLDDFKTANSLKEVENLKVGLDGFATALKRQETKLARIKEGNIFDIFGDKNKRAAKIAEAEKDYRAAVGNIALIVRNLEQQGVKVDWNAMFDMSYIADGSPVDKMIQDINARVATIQDGLDEAAGKAAGVFAAHGLAGLWYKELDDGQQVLENFVNNTKAYTEGLHEDLRHMVGKISEGNADVILANMRAVIDFAEETERAFKAGEIDQEEANKRRILNAKLSSEIGRQANDMLAKDNNAWQASQLKEVDKWYKEQRRLLEKHVDDTAFYQLELTRIFEERLKKEKAILERYASPKEQIKQLRADNKATENANKIHLETIEQQAQDGVITHEDAEVRKAEASIAAYKTILDNAKQTIKTFNTMGTVEIDSAEYEKAQKILIKAEKELEKSRTDLLTAGSKRRIILLKKDNRELARETARSVAEINKSAAEGTISRAAADENIRKKQIELIDGQIKNHEELYRTQYKGNEANEKAKVLMQRINDLKIQRISLETAEAQAVRDNIELTKELNDEKLRAELEYQKARLEMGADVAPGIDAEYARAAVIAGINNQLAAQEVRITKDKLQEIEGMTEKNVNDLLIAKQRYQDALSNQSLTELEGEKSISKAKLTLVENQWRNSLIAAQKYFDAIDKAREDSVISTAEAAERELDIIYDLWQKGTASVEAYHAALLKVKQEGGTITPAEEVEATGDAVDNLAHGIKQAIGPTKSWNQEFQELGETGTALFVGGLMSAMDSFIDGTKDAKEAFEDFAQDFLKQIALMIMQALILKAINAALGFGLSSGGEVMGPPKPPGLATGGRIPGQSPTSTADNIPIWATAGEFMQPVAAVQKYGMAFMESIRTLRLNPDTFKGFNMGGLIGGFESAMSMASGGIVNNSSTLAVSVPVNVNGVANAGSLPAQLQIGIENTVMTILRREMR